MEIKDEAIEVRISFTEETIKTEDDEKYHSSQLNGIKTEDDRETNPPTTTSAEYVKTETDGEDFGGPVPTRSSDTLLLNDNNHVSETNAEDDCCQKSADFRSEADDSGYSKTGVSRSSLNFYVCCSTTETSFGCVKCGKQFHHKKSLTRHLHVHAGENPFPCQTCGEAFSQNIALKRHLTIHKEEKVFRCEHCGKTFSHRWYLRKHVKIHTGKKGI
ncbi:hypothetical protein CHARACLAT_030106 [Characodon lateralis]|uniref:C2H2-type domain-containing protein n=1 Tax=Characodon lateralis TaxID=208331 RepID=A0ABU7EY03_9TELE|nr:hypothetical protein [Characodon lateralis]